MDDRDKHIYPAKMHLLIHNVSFGLQMLEVLNDLNRYAGGTNMVNCPVENCTFQITTKKLANDMVQHYAITHFGVLNHLSKEYDAQKLQKCKQILRIYRTVCIGEDFACENCMQIFGSARELWLHRAKQHVTNQLMEIFRSTHRPISSGNMMCGYCEMTFNLNFDGAIHLGVVHHEMIKKTWTISSEVTNVGATKVSAVTKKPNVVVYRNIQPKVQTLQTLQPNPANQSGGQQQNIQMYIQNVGTVVSVILYFNCSRRAARSFDSNV